MRTCLGIHRILLLQSPNKLHPCSDASNTLKSTKPNFDLNLRGR